MLAVLLFSLGHFTVDLYSSGLASLQPLLVSKLQFSLTQAGFLAGLLVLSSSLLQPLYGYLSDRYHSSLFTILAPAVAGVFMSALGLAPSYLWLLPLAFLGGAGVAAFHPQASARVAGVVEEKQGGAMSLFVSAGTLGCACGPLFFSMVAGRFGLAGLHWGASLGVMVSLLLISTRQAPPGAAHARRGFEWQPLRDAWRPLLLLYFLVFLRSILQTTFTQFLPLYLNLERGASLTHANYTLTAYLAAGAFGGFIGGYLADRFGGRRIILLSMAASAPFLALFFFRTGWVALAGLVLGGFFLMMTLPVNVVMAQQLAPSQAGTVSALMMGFAWGAAGVTFVPMVGWAADLFTLDRVLTSLTLFPVLGVLLALRLPK